MLLFKYSRLIYDRSWAYEICPRFQDYEKNVDIISQESSRSALESESQLLLAYQ